MRDRLKELRSEVPPDEAQPDDVTVVVEGEEEQNFMAEFFNKVSLIKKNMDKIAATIKQVKEKHDKLLNEVKSDQQKVLKAEIHDLMDEVSAIATRVRAALKGMDEENKKAEKENTAEGLPADIRIRKSQHTTLSRQFVQVMTEYNDIQTKNKKNYRGMIARQCKIVNPEVTDNQVDAVVENGPEGLFQGKRLEQAEEALRIIKDRHEDIMALEKSLLELHEMFLDMALLVESQGAMIDRIEHSVEQSANYTERAAEMTRKAAVYKKKIRRKQICIGGCCLFIIAVVVAVAIGITI